MVKVSFRKNIRTENKDSKTSWFISSLGRKPKEETQQKKLVSTDTKAGFIVIY